MIFASFSRFFKVKESNLTFLASAQNVIGLLYGVLLAFMVILSWQYYSKLNDALVDEASQLLTIWRDAKYFNKEDQKKIEIAILNYAKSVNEFEWSPEKDQVAALKNPNYINLLDSIKTLTPQSNLQKIALESLVNELNELNKTRRSRIFAFESKTPSVFWVFLICGGLYLLMITALFYNSHHRLVIFVLVSQASLIIYALYLISIFSNPYNKIFENSCRVKMEMVINTIKTP